MCIRSFTSIGRLHYGSGRFILPSSYSSQISVTLDLGSKILFWTAAGTATLAELVCRPPAGHSGHTTLAELAVVRRRAAGS